MKRKNTFVSTKNLRPIIVLAVVMLMGGVVWQRMASATTESSGATTEKQQLAQVQTRASSEIDRRINSLNALSPLIVKLAKPTLAQQKSYTKAVEAEIKTLQKYATAINSDATLTAATKDAQKLTPEYTAFMVLVPKAWLIITADWQQVLEAKFTTYANKVQDRLNIANNAGKDISAAQITLNDLQSQVATAKELSDGVATDVPLTQLGQYNANHSVLMTHYHKLATARDKLATALDDAKNLRDEVSGL
jgi:hypothetical protein